MNVCMYEDGLTNMYVYVCMWHIDTVCMYVCMKMYSPMKKCMYVYMYVCVCVCMAHHDRVENSKCFSRNMMVAFRSPSLNS